MLYKNILLYLWCTNPFSVFSLNVQIFAKHLQRIITLYYQEWTEVRVAQWLSREQRDIRRSRATCGSGFGAELGRLLFFSCIDNMLRLPLFCAGISIIHVDDIITNIGQIKYESAHFHLIFSKM